MICHVVDPELYDFDDDGSVEYDVGVVAGGENEDTVRWDVDGSVGIVPPVVVDTVTDGR